MKLTNVVIIVLVITQCISFYLYFSLNNSHQELIAEFAQVNSSLTINYQEFTDGLARVNSSLTNNYHELVAELGRVDSSLKEENAQLIQAYEEEIARIDGSIQSLPKPPTSEEVVVSLMETVEIVPLLAEVLSTNEEYIEKLRGQPGPPPGLEGTIQYLMDSKGTELVSLLSKKLSTDEEYVEKLRGLPGTPPRAEEVVQSLMVSKSAELVGLLAKELSIGEEYVEKLRGLPGTPPGAEEVALHIISLESNVLISAFEQEFWRQRKADILENSGLVADVAEVVYQTYGENLKGKDAQMPTLEEIAQVLSNDYKFAQMVADFKE